MISEEVVDTQTNPYALAGWLSILHAGILLAKSGVEILPNVVSLSSSGYLQLLMGFHALGVLVGIYVLFMFRRFLNEQHGFHKVDALIVILILINIIAALVDAAGMIFLSQYNAISAILIVYALASLVGIFYGVRLLKLDNDLSGLLKPYAYATIAAGACGVTLYLSHVASLIYTVSLILLGIILIRARSEFEYL